jgi:hypothetical protein
VSAPFAARMLQFIPGVMQDLFADSTSAEHRAAGLRKHTGSGHKGMTASRGVAILMFSLRVAEQASIRRICAPFLRRTVI